MPNKGKYIAITLKEGNEIYKKIKKILPYHMILVGSARREEEYLNDLDILLVVNDINDVNIVSTVSSIFKQVLRTGQRIITGEYNYKNKLVHIDFFITLKKELPFALLHYTGPKMYNIRIRKYIKDKYNWLLNQYGLFYVNNPHLRVKYSSNIKTEEDLINFIGTHFYLPSERK